MSSPATTPNETVASSTSATLPSPSLENNGTRTTSPFYAADYRNGVESADNRYRPYSTAPIEHDPMTSTIILVQANPTSDTQTESDRNADDYFAQFTSFLNEVDSSIEASNSGTIPFLDKVGNGGKFYGLFKNFSIIGFNESRAEISKVNLNFGLRWNAYFFGSQPRIYSYSGVFLDAKNYPYYEQFMKAYDNYLAGGKCVEEGFRMYMAYDNKIVSGWMLSINTTGTADQRFTKQFSFQILVESDNFYRFNDNIDIDYDYYGQSRELNNEFVIGDSL